MGGLLAGAFIVSDSLAGAAASALPLASAIAGACFLGMEDDAEVSRDLLRHGKCDFVVNTLDEALRILKNELRQMKPVSVCLTGSVTENVRQMGERGVAPNLVLQTRPLPLIGATGCRTEELDSLVHRSPNQRGELAQWTLSHGTAATLARLDALVLALIPQDDRQRRRWLEAAQRYIPREGAPSRIFSLTHSERERFLDSVCARIMSGEIPAPVEVAISGEHMVLGAECGS